MAFLQCSNSIIWRKKAKPVTPNEKNEVNEKNLVIPNIRPLSVNNTPIMEKFSHFAQELFKHYGEGVYE